eukprot:85325_1
MYNNRKRRNHNKKETTNTDTDDDTVTQPQSKKRKPASCKRLVVYSPGFGFHNLQNKVSIAYTTIKYNYDKGRMQYITNILHQMVIAFSWIKYLPNGLELEEIFKLYDGSTLVKVGSKTLETFIDRYNEYINMKIFPKDVLLDDPTQPHEITAVELEQYLEIVCKSPHVHPFISIFKKYVCDPKYNPHGIFANNKEFKLNPDRNGIYCLLETLEQQDHNAVAVVPYQISDASMNIDKYVKELKMENQIQKVSIATRDKVIQDLEQELVKLRNLVNVPKKELIKCLQNKYENPLSLKRFVKELVKVPQLKKAIKIVDIKEDEKKQPSNEQSLSNFLLQGNRIRMALQTIHGKINYLAVDGLKAAVDSVPILVCAPEDKLNVEYEKKSNNLAGRSEIIKIIHRWEQIQPYYEHKYMHYLNGYGGFQWLSPHVTFPNVCGFLIEYFKLLITNDMLINRYGHHLYNKKATDSRKIPVLIGKVDGARSACWTWPAFTVGSLCYSGWEKSSTYHNVPFFGVAGGDKINVKFIRHEFERVNELKYKADIVMPWNAVQHRIPINKVPLILIMDRALMNALNYHMTCSSDTPLLFSYLFRKIQTNDPHKQLKIQKYSANGYELIETNKKWWDSIRTFDLIFDISELETRDDFKSDWIITLPYEPILTSKIDDMKRDVQTFFKGKIFANNNEKEKAYTDKAKELIKGAPYEIGYYDHPLSVMLKVMYIPPLHSLLRGPGDGFSKHFSFLYAPYGQDVTFIIPFLKNVKGLETFASVLENTIKNAPAGVYFLASTNGNVVKLLCEQYGTITYFIEANLVANSERELKWKQMINMGFLRRVEIHRNRLGLLVHPPKGLKSSDPNLRKWARSGIDDYGILQQVLDGMLSPTDYAICNMSVLIFQRFLKFKEEHNLDIEYKHLIEEDLESDNCIIKGMLRDKANRRDQAISTVVKQITFYRICGIEQYMREFIKENYSEDTWSYSVPNTYYPLDRFCKWSQDVMWAMRKRDHQKINDIMKYFLNYDHGKETLKNIDDIYQKNKAYKYSPTQIVDKKAKKRNKANKKGTGSNRNKKKGNKKGNTGSNANHNKKRPQLMEYDE